MAKMLGLSRNFFNVFKMYNIVQKISAAVSNRSRCLSILSDLHIYLLLKKSYWENTLFFKKATHIIQIYIYLILMFDLLKKWIWASKTVSKNFNSTTCTQCTLTKPLEKSCATLSENFVKESFLRGEFFLYTYTYVHQYILCIL